MGHKSPTNFFEEAYFFAIFPVRASLLRIEYEGVVYNVFTWGFDKCFLGRLINSAISWLVARRCHSSFAEKGKMSKNMLKLCVSMPPVENPMQARKTIFVLCRKPTRPRHI